MIYPGKLVLYEDDNYSSWKGTIILANMQVCTPLLALLSLGCLHQVYHPQPSSPGV